MAAIARPGLYSMDPGDRKSVSHDIICIRRFYAMFSLLLLSLS